MVRFEDSGIVLRAYAWADEPVKAIIMHYDINERVKRRFDKDGIEIPYPYRTIVQKSDLKAVEIKE